MLGGNKNGSDEDYNLKVIVSITAVTNLLNALIDLIKHLSR